MSTLGIFDGNELAFRSFSTRQLVTSDGKWDTSVLHGVYSLMKNVLKNHEMDHFIITWDAGYKRRIEIDPKYKQNRRDRKKEDSDFDFEQYIASTKVARFFFDKINFPQVRIRGIEADDIIGVASEFFKTRLDHVYIVSTDKDMYQLLDKSVTLLRQVGKQIYTYEDFKKEYEIEPYQWVDVKALMGDAGDNIEGIKGVGEKTALKAIKTWGNTESIYWNKDVVKRQLKKAGEKICDGEEIVALAKKLVGIARVSDWFQDLTDPFRVEFKKAVRDMKTKKTNLKNFLKLINMLECNSIAKHDLENIFNWRVK